MARSFLCLALLVLFFAPHSVAQQQPAQSVTASSDDSPATKEDIERYLKVLNAREMMRNMMTTMSASMRQLLHERFEKQKDKLPPDFEATMSKRLEEYLAALPIDQILDSMVPIYQKHFTKGDINALIGFYSSPVGQKVLHELPQITAEAMQSAMPLIQNNIQKLSERVQQDVEAMIQQSDKPHSRNPASSSPK